HVEDPRVTSAAVTSLLAEEARRGLQSLVGYAGFQAKADQLKDNVLMFLLKQKLTGKTVAGYGAAAKGNTLLNYAGVKPDLLPFVVDRNPAKQGKFLPGSRIPIVDEKRLTEEKPDYVVIFPWNLKHEVMKQLSYIQDWNGQFVVAIPELQTVDGSAAL